VFHLIPVPPEFLDTDNDILESRTEKQW